MDVCGMSIRGWSDARRMRYRRGGWLGAERGLVLAIVILPAFPVTRPVRVGIAQLVDQGITSRLDVRMYIDATFGVVYIFGSSRYGRMDMWTFGTRFESCARKIA